MWGRVLVLLGLMAAAAGSIVRAEEPRVTARAAIIVDAATGEVLWERNADWQLPPASTTKVMTAILAIESRRLDDSVTIDPEVADIPPSKIGLRGGERMVLGDLLYAVLLNSANDAAAAVADALAGSENEFAIKMNAKARAIGARNTHFVNPHGLTAEGHVSTARDLSTIFRYGLKLPTMREILETPRIKVPIQSRRVSALSLHSHNRLLTGYVHRVIGKTGYTKPAGRCFVGATSQDGREVVIALMGSTDLWGDARRLFAHAFGESAEAPVVQMASRGRRGRTAAQIITTEGDDEDVVEKFKKGNVHLASVDRKTTRTTSRTVSSGKRVASSDSFAVRLGPYPSRKSAEAARNRLAKSGVRGRVVGQAVMVGEYPSRAGADKAAKGLRSKGYSPTIVSR
jgi:serine-type D-Ala-D-Ala carboxypeptidase (penicillin-binding protein 5/6)